MNELEKLEAELKELRPLRPSEEFTNRLEKALGNAGNVAMRCLPDGEPDANVSDHSAPLNTVFSFPRLLTFTGLTGLGLAAVWVMIFYLSASLTSDGPAETSPEEAPLLVQSITQEVNLPLMDDPDSPLHGLSLNEIQDVSVMPVSGWLDPQMNERFLRVVDEGVFDRPSGLPARRVRHYFMDETLWSHPASDTRILSTTPREEVIFIELDTY